MRSAGIRVREVAAADDGLPDLASSLRALYDEGIGSVLVEGGAKLLTSLILRDLWDAVTVFIAPLILGQGIEAVGDLGIGRRTRGSSSRMRMSRFVTDTSDWMRATRGSRLRRQPP